MVGTAHPTTADSAPPTRLIKIAGPHAVTQLPGFAEGLFTVQDPSAAQAVRILDPQPGWSILDLCSAPGTKTLKFITRIPGKSCHRHQPRAIDRDRTPGWG
jgi:16S rRNA C967 or C1407 C5-methylase (RsmB/RsmF family)